MNKKHYIILPACDDHNRGDQALVWETIRIAKDAGYDGSYYVMSDSNDIFQSVKKGYNGLDNIIKHPSKFYKNKNNIIYNKKMILIWGLISIISFLYSLLLLIPKIRDIAISCSSSKVKKTIKLIRTADAIFVKGGGFIHSYGGITAPYHIYYLLFPILLSLSYKKDVYILPNSFGPFKGFMVNRMVTNTLKRCKYVSVRETISKDMLKEYCNLDSVLHDDLAFHLQEDLNFDAISLLLDKYIPIGKKRCVALTVRPYRFPGKENPEILYKEYKIEIALFIKWLSENGYFPVLIEHVYNELHHESDISCINEIEELLENVEYGVYANRNLNCSQLKKIYSCFDYIIGTRFHSLIFSLSSNIPGIAITYGGNKGLGIMQDIGMGDYSIPIDSLSSCILIEKFNNLLQNELEIKQKISKYLDELDNGRNKLILELR